MSKQCMLSLFLLAGVCLCISIPSVSAQERYAVETGAGMTVTIDDPQDALRLETYTYEFWLRDFDGTTGAWRNVFRKGAGAVNNQRGPLLALRNADDGLHFSQSTGSGQQTANLVGGFPVDEWAHVALELTGLTGDMIIYLNGVEAARTSGVNVTATPQDPVLVFTGGAHCALDDFRVWNYARSETEILEGMGQELAGDEDGLVGYWTFNEGTGTTASDTSPSQNHATLAGALWNADSAPVEPSGPQATAYAPVPANGATDVHFDTDLSWKPGEFAATHDVYFGTNFEDVSNGSGDVLAAEGLTEPSLALDDLEFETQYFWRVDDVENNNNTYQGDVWSFTVEDLALEVTGVTATASSSQDDEKVAARTVDGSGLNANGEHSSNLADMWLSNMAETEGVTITFDLGAVYKLNHVHVWNHNSQTETILGYGIKEALIETSEDGATWTELKTVEIAQAPGSDTYTGTDVALDGVIARHVRLTALSNYSILGLKQFGLSEVRFYSIPVLAREPNPANGGTSDGVDVTLQWRAGREAVEHEVVFSDDEQAVINGSAVVGTVDDPAFDLGTLDLGSQYFWKINSRGDMTYEGDLWTFQTPDQIMIEDFEMYKAKEGLFIWEHWIDGFDNPNENGAVVGNGDEPETDQVYEGSQSMPLVYNNTGAPKSEATRTFDPPVDLASGNPEAIEVYVKGIPYEFNGYYSVDGSGWTSMSWNPQYIVMGEQAHVGMAVCSHDVALETTAVFTNVSTTGNVTGDWTQADIGGTHPAGNFTEANGTFTIKALGADIWTTADELRYVYKHLDGAGSITAQVQSLDPVNAWTKVGVMIRETTDVGASNGGVYATGTNGVRYQARLDTDMAAVSDTDVLDGTQQIMDTPVWVRMERKLANGAAPIYMTLTDTAGKSATIETENTAATTVGTWTLLSAAPGDLNVNLSQIESITIGVGTAGVEGRIFVDAIRTYAPPSSQTYALLAQYPFDEGAGTEVADTSGKGLDGALVGEPVWVPGRIGTALQFDGVDDYVEIPHDDALNVDSEVTLALWINPERYVSEGEGWGGIMAKGSPRLYSLFTTAAGEIHFSTADVGTVSAETFPLNEWSHVAAMVVDGGHAYYINGAPAGTAGSGINLAGVTNTAPVTIGNINETNRFYQGMIDEVYIYGRALTDAEVMDLATR